MVVTCPLREGREKDDKDRSGYEEVKKEVLNFACDILKLWEGLSKNPDLAPYGELLKRRRDDAIREATRVGEQYKGEGYEFPFSQNG
jgi:hypothetical protein